MNLPPLDVLGPLIPGPVPRRRLDDAVDAALARLGGPAEDLTVLVNDPQRHTDSRAVLESLARHVDLTRLRLLVACGSHRFAPAAREAFARALAGEWRLQRPLWHDAYAEDLAPIGQGEHRWRAHPWLAQAGPLLAIGSVEPHYFAGLTGAHKTATIGGASYDDIQANHAHALGSLPRPCRLEGNPIFEGVRRMLQALEARRPVAAINLIQAGRDIAAAAGGTALEALGALAGPCERCFVRRIDQPADALVVQAEGVLGRSFYQADKAIKNSEWALRDGGVIVLEAPCTDGIGQDDFVRLLRAAATYQKAKDLVDRQGYRLGDHKAVRLRYLTDPACRGVRIYAVTPGLSPADAAVLGFTQAESAEQALVLAGIVPGRDRVYRVRDAGNVCVIVSSPSWPVAT